MRTFHCECGAPTFFDNTLCLTCGRELGFLPDALELVSLAQEGSSELSTPHGQYRKCSNYATHGVCNWMVSSASPASLCQACELNHVIPDLSLPENKLLWMEVEKAKRRLVYSLNRLQLPLVPKSADPIAGLSFDIKADEGNQRVLTGHSDGLITLNLAEADAAQRESMRTAMKERYRTLLGHFRHEIGHYYWDRLVRDTSALSGFRELFGDETADYMEALRVHYSKPPALDYADHYISNYAASHPWEDFAETFAHYLHLVDTLETAQQFGFVSKRIAKAPLAEAVEFEPLMTEWCKLTVALNSLNRSMGLPDAYPFAITDKVNEKLRFVHQLIRDEQARQANLRIDAQASATPPHPVVTEASTTSPSAA